MSGKFVACVAYTLFAGAAAALVVLFAGPETEFAKAYALTYFGSVPGIWMGTFWFGDL